MKNPIKLVQTMDQETAAIAAINKAKAQRLRDGATLPANADTQNIITGSTDATGTVTPGAPVRPIAVRSAIAAPGTIMDSAPEPEATPEAEAPTPEPTPCSTGNCPIPGAQPSTNGLGGAEATPDAGGDDTAPLTPEVAVPAGAPAEVAVDEVEVAAEPEAEPETEPETEPEVEAEPVPVATVEAEASPSPEVVTSAATPTPETSPAIALAMQTLRDTLNQQGQEALEVERQRFQAELDRLRADHEAELAQAQTQAAQAQTERDALENVFRLTGQAVPTPSTTHSTDTAMTTTTPAPVNSGKGPQGALAELLQTLQDRNVCPAKTWIDPNSGDHHVQKDTRVAQTFYRMNKAQVRADLESWLKKEGLLRGTVSTDAVSGATTGASSSVPDGFLEILSVMMRETHNPRYIYWQFPTTVTRLGNGPGANILIPRFDFLDEPTSPDDYLLSEPTAFYDVSASNQALVMSTVPATVKEWGLGKGGSTGLRPVAIPEFITAYSLADLESALQSRLMMSYHQFEDIAIRSMLSATSEVYYNNDDVSLTQDPLDLAAGDVTIMTEKLLDLMHERMRILNVPTLADGCYIAVLHPTAVRQFKGSLDAKMDAPDAASLEELTNILQAQGSSEIGKVSGYLGKFNGFHLFETNAHSTGAAGTEGVTSETIAASGTALFRSSYFFGRSVMGRGVGMPMEVRQSSESSFGRLVRYIWLSHEAFVPLDVDPNSTSPANNQQLRVFEVRTTDVSL